MKDVIFIINVTVLLLIAGALFINLFIPEKQIWPPKHRNSGGQYFMLLTFNLAAIGIIILGILDWNNNNFPVWMRVFGVIFWIAGISFAGWSIVSLGLRSTSGDEEHLIKTGPYQISRNPQYVGFIVGLTGWGLVTSSVKSLTVSLMATIPLIIVPLVEEPWLQKKYGQEYKEYKREVSRFLSFNKIKLPPSQLPSTGPVLKGSLLTISSAERKARAGLPLVRFMQSYLPLPAAHWLLEQGAAHVQLKFGATRKALSADGVSCEWIILPNSQTDRVLLYLHGGGFVFGLTPPHLQMGAYLAQKINARVLMVDYRLAPDHPFPAALDDCVTAYRWLLKQGIAARNIVVAGDSAGGNLTITSLMKLRDDGDPLPAAAACLSPVTDLSNKNNTKKEIRDPLLPPKAIQFYNKAYVAHNDPRNPLISPVFGNLHNLPPLLVHAGEEEILRDDAIRIVELAKSAGVSARLEIYPRMWHVWQINLSLPQAIQSLDEIAHFLQMYLELVQQ